MQASAIRNPTSVLRPPATLRSTPRIAGCRSNSRKRTKRARFACGQSLLDEEIKAAALRVSGDPFVPKSLTLIVKPFAQLEEFVGGQMLDRPLDFLHGAHGRNLAPALLKPQLLRPPPDCFADHHDCPVSPGMSALPGPFGAADRTFIRANPCPSVAGLTCLYRLRSARGRASVSSCRTASL